MNTKLRSAVYTLFNKELGITKRVTVIQQKPKCSMQWECWFLLQ